MRAELHLEKVTRSKYKKRNVCYVKGTCSIQTQGENNLSILTLSGGSLGGIFLLRLGCFELWDPWDAESILVIRQAQQFLYTSIDQHMDHAGKRETWLMVSDNMGCWTSLLELRTVTNKLSRTRYSISLPWPPALPTKTHILHSATAN